MRGVQAWEVLNDPDRCSQLNMEQIHKYMIRAGYSEEAARESAMQRGWDRLSAGDTV